MRTTVNLPDQLLVEARKLAADRRTTLTQVLIESLREHLVADRRRRASSASDAGLPVILESRPRPGVDLDDTSALWELE